MLERHRVSVVRAPSSFVVVFYDENYQQLLGTIHTGLLEDIVLET